VVQVDSRLFEEFWEARGKNYLAVDEESKFLLHELMTDVENHFLDIVCIPEQPPVATVDMSSWSSVIEWVNLSSIPIYFDWMEDEQQTRSPHEYFGSREKLLADVIEAVIEENLSSCSVWSVQLECCGRSLELVYNDTECWGLGHGDSVLVVEDLSKVTSHTGYFAYPDS